MMYWITTQEYGEITTMEQYLINKGIRRMSTMIYQMKMNKNRVKFIMNGSDRILSMLCIDSEILNPAHAIFVLGNQYPKILKN